MSRAARRAASRAVTVAACGIGAALIGGCSSTEISGPPPPPQMPLIASHVLAVPEPSDVTIDESGTTLWVVGNHPEKVYQLNTSGGVVRTLAYTGQDLEGIAYDRRDTTLWVVEENQRRVVHLDRDGNVLSTHPLGVTGEQNSGLEGICLNDQGQMFVLNEKLPGMFIEVDNTIHVTSKDTLTFAGDYSGISHNPQMGCFWIVSDQSQRFYLWNPPNHVLAEYSLPFEKPEGIAFDPVSDRIYVVSDATHTLYIYQNTAGSAPAGSRAP